jgi:hypothetical protein
MLERKCVAIVAAIALWLLPAAATQALSVQVLDASLRDGVYHVSLEARVDAPVDDVAAVLTDYAAYRSLDPRIRSSAVLPPTGQETMLVRTVVYACAGLFCKNVERVERVERKDGELIATVIPDRSELKSRRGNSRYLRGGVRAGFLGADDHRTALRREGPESVDPGALQ